MQVFLIRHTTPELTAGLIYGRLEVPLKPDFEQEIIAVKANLPADIDRVYSSPASRCALLAKEIDPGFLTDHRLAELHFGDWEGKTWDTVDQAELQLWMDDFVHVRVPQGENMLDLRDRVNAFLQELKRVDLPKVAIVTHAGVIRMLLTLHQNLPLADFFRIEVAYGQVIQLELNELRV